MSKFNDFYLTIINELTKYKNYSFIQENLEKPIIITKQTKYSIKNIPVIEIKDTDKIPNIFDSTNLIKQSKYTYGIKLLKIIYQAKGFLNPINKQTILNNLNQNWQYYNLFKQHKQIPIFNFKISFSNPNLSYNKGFYTILNHFGIIFEELQKPHLYNLPTNIPKQDLYNNFFIQNYSTDNGLIFPIDDQKAIMYLNTDKPFKGTLTTISHELTHYMQAILGVDLINTNVKIKNNKKQIFNQSIKDIQYLFNSKQFIPHIKSDLLLTLDRLYAREKIKFKYFSRADFAVSVIQSVKDDPQNVLNSYIGKLWTKYFSQDYSALFLFASTLILEREDLFNLICNILREHFK